MKRLTLLCTVMLLSSLMNVYAQGEIALNQKTGWKDICYDPHVSSIQLFKGTNELSVPVISLGMDEYLTLWFDDLSEERTSLRYTIVHCDADWSEDNLFLTDYMTGFAENWLNDFKHSHITRVNYRHYELQVPNRNVQLKISGNYLLKVYETDAAHPIFVRGFSVLENKTTAAWQLRGPVVTGEECLQQLEFSINHPTLEVRNAFRDLKVRVFQNGYRMPTVDHPVPVFVENNRTNYAQHDRNWYAGGNEFRFFDTRNLEFSGQGVVQMRTDDNGFVYALLQKDEFRDSRYSYVRDMNGGFYIDAYRTNDRQIAADYVTTIFTLASEPLNGYVYVFGKLTDFTLNPNFKMEYNAQLMQYELNALVKQGLYNYRYVFVDKQGNIDWNLIEGCYSETENGYAVYVYYRSIRDRYDRLVGFFSMEQQ